MTEAKSVFDYHIVDGQVTTQKLASSAVTYDKLATHVGKAYFVNKALGADTNDGLTPATALATVAAAEDKTTTGKHDTVFLIASATQDSVAATIAWDKSYTHLLGIGPPFPGIGQRSRLASSVAAPALTITGSGCIFANLQVQNSYAGASGGVLVDGAYNYFENVYFNGMNGAGAADAAGSYCLSVTKAENYFRNCTIGSCQTVRTSTNSELLISTGSQTFEGCRIQKYSETATNFLVQLVAGTAGMSLLHFKKCVFYNQTVNWATGITNVFNVAQTGSHYVLLDGCVAIGGAGAGITWADTATHVYQSNANPGTGGSIVSAVAS